MGPALSPGQVGQEAAACAVLGACLGAGRAFFPVRGRGALLPDVLLMGGLLLGTQSYAASLSAGGVPRWYMLAAAIAGPGAAQAAGWAGKIRRGPCPGPCRPQKGGQRTPERKKTCKKTEKELAK